MEPLCKNCIHKYVCRKSEGYYEAYRQNGLVLQCDDYMEKDSNTRIKREAKEMLENILYKEFKNG